MTVTGLPTTPMPTASRPRLEIPAVTLLALIPAAAKLVSYPDYPGSDDSFIHLSVVQNIATGQGWGVTPGHPVNLSSSPFYTVMLLLLRPLGGIGLAQIVSAACATAGLVFVYLTARRMTRSVPLALVTLAVAAANVQLWRWTGTVMETTLGFLMCAATVYGVYRITPRSSRWAYLGLGLLIGAATLTRFELGMLLPLAALDLWLRGSRDRLALLVPGFTIGVAPWLVFSYLYFGTPIPTTLAAKTVGLILANVSVTKDLAEAVVSGYGPALLAGVAALALTTRSGKLGNVLSQHLLVFAWPVALFTFYYLKTPILQSPGRYYLPGMVTIPLAVVLLFVAAPRLMARPVLAGLGIASVAVAVCANLLLVAPTLTGFNDNYRPAMVGAAAFLRGKCDGTALVVTDIGILTDQGIGNCTVADAGALASPELRGMTLDQMIAATRPQFVVESIGSSQGSLLPEHPQLRLVQSRAYLSHGVSTRGVQDWLNIYTVV